MDKDVGFRIRIDRELREQFLEVCRAQDKPAAQVLREFMRDYIQTHEAANDRGVRAEPVHKKHSNKTGQP
ncbi:MAG: hypothetical protein AAFV45_12760 [Pseudomonadota bacterium]